MKLLPIPSRDYTPPMDGDGPLKDMLDHIFLGWYWDVFELEWCRDPVRMRPNTLDPLGEFLSAGIRPGDTDRAKRVKIALAIDHIKARGTWAKVKETVDAVTGTDAQIFNPATTGRGGDDWIIMGGWPSTFGPDVKSNLFSIIGGRDGSEPFGIKVSGGTDRDGDSGSLIAGPGHVYIDLRDSTLSLAVRNAVKADLLLEVPAYFKVYIGWYDELLLKYTIFPEGEI